MKVKLLALAVLLAALFPGSSFAGPNPDPGSVSLTISVFNDAGVPPSVLSAAEARAVLIMRRAGISLAWLDCGTPGKRPSNAGCSAISFPQHLSIRLVSRGSPRGEDTFGQSFQDAAGSGSYAVVYFRTLQSSKAAEAINPGDLLGHVVVHELGHLLLGLNSHATTGLMSAVWQEAELRQASRGNLFFSGDEGERIRSRYLLASARLGKKSEPPSANSGN